MYHKNVIIARQNLNFFTILAHLQRVHRIDARTYEIAVNNFEEKITSMTQDFLETEVEFNPNWKFVLGFILAKERLECPERFINGKIRFENKDNRGRCVDKFDALKHIVNEASFSIEFIPRREIVDQVFRIFENFLWYEKIIRREKPIITLRRPNISDRVTLIDDQGSPFYPSEWIEKKWLTKYEEITPFPETNNYTTKMLFRDFMETDSGYLSFNKLSMEQKDWIEECCNNII